jgi:hypothetical protein
MLTTGNEDPSEASNLTSGFVVVVYFIVDV